MFDPDQRVIVTDVKIPFWSMVWLMVKWSIAAIPAAIILTALAAICVALFAALASNLRLPF